MCNLAFWLHREPIGLQSGRRACAVGWTPGFRQANSKQEIRKSAEQRDNDMEIRDEITPTSGWLSCLFTDHDFLSDTCMPSMKRTRSNTTRCILTSPLKRTSRPFACSNTLSSWCAPQCLPHCTLFVNTSSSRFTPTISQVMDAAKTTRPNFYDTWLKCRLKPPPGWHHLPAWSCLKEDGQQVWNTKSLHLETEEKAPPQGHNAPVLLSSDLTWLIYWAEEDFHAHNTPEELWKGELTLGKVKRNSSNIYRLTTHTSTATKTKVRDSLGS